MLHPLTAAVARESRAARWNSSGEESAQARSTTSVLTVEQRSQDFLRAARDKTSTRAVCESWTTQDVRAASLQASLLSYCDLVDSAPEHYKHNCPWNDWTPPSKALLRQAPIEDRLKQRVRVHLHASPDLRSKALIAFASVEMGRRATKFLCIRRGAEVLAKLDLSMLRCELAGPRLARLSDRLSPRPPSVVSNTAPVFTVPDVIYLHFDCGERLSKFLTLLDIEISMK